MSSICLIGNSHVANLKMALPVVLPDFPGMDLVFFASDGRSMELEINSGRLVGCEEFVRDRMAMTSGRDGGIAPIYDAYVICGLTLSSIRALRTFWVTMKELRAIGRNKSVTPEIVARGMETAVKGSLAIDIVSKLRRITNAPAFVIATPLSARERHVDTWSTLEKRRQVELVANGFNLACHQASQEHAATFLPQPQETIGPNAFTTRPEFYRLSPEETAVETAHHAHMNTAFGAIVLRDALIHTRETLSSSPGLEPT
ncbi:MAG TPA: hypothetical protein VHE09_08395 [Rhizomicrobium sp.]|nr:hypothetical protein [Rhizomicrobium sp.]